MPLLEITVSTELPPERTDALARRGSSLVAAVLGKPEAWVMVVCKRAPILFGGDDRPAALLEVRSLGGLDPAVNARLAADLGALVEELAGVPLERTFLNFVDVARADWGWNGATLARG